MPIIVELPGAPRFAAGSSPVSAESPADVIFHHLEASSVPLPQFGVELALQRQEPYMESSLNDQEQRAMPVRTDADLTPLQVKSLLGLSVFKQATADLLLRYAGIRSVRYLQKQLYALHAANPQDRYIEWLPGPKPVETQLDSDSQSRFLAPRH